MTETENLLSPFKMADSIGEAPRYFGKREGWMFRIPSGSKTSRTSDLIMTPKEARMPWASGFLALISFAVSRSSLLLAWKIISQCFSRTFLVASARGPLPKKMTLFIGKKLFIIFDFFIIIDWIEVAFVVHFKEGVFLVFDVVNKENTIEMVDFV